MAGDQIWDYVEDYISGRITRLSGRWRSSSIQLIRLYFVCYMIERTARHLKQPNQYVVGKMTKQDLERQLSIAATNHCMNPMEVVAAR